MQKRAGRRRQDTADTERYEQRVEADDKVVVRVNAAHQRHAELPVDADRSALSERSQSTSQQVSPRAAIKKALQASHPMLNGYYT